MGKIKLLDCTLRDGGYVNDWMFGEDAIKGIISKLAQTGIEMIEVGFIKGDEYNPNRSVFPDIESIRNILTEKAPGVCYVGMIDMSAPIPIERICPYDGTSIDTIRVIFKKNRLEEAYTYVKAIKSLGYKVFANFVSTDAYSDKEFIEGIEKFNRIKPYGVAIVDTFGTIKKRLFRRLVDIADNNLDKDIVLCYHAHNNLQQAFGNAETLVEMNLRREVCIDACVFGMGRGAGNLNLELFAEYMNENYDTGYKIAPMLLIMDEYLTGFYKTKFWGYSLPLYLSAKHSCHPNYAIYLAEKNSLSVSAFDELMQSISKTDKAVFSKEKAEQYYRNYLRHHVDDTEAVRELTAELADKKIILLAPGKSVATETDKIREVIGGRNDSIVLSINYYDENFKPDYVFISNMRRYSKIKNTGTAKIIATSNIDSKDSIDYLVNYQSYNCSIEEISDNGGIMALQLLCALGVREVFIAGMDGYSVNIGDNYYVSKFEADQFSPSERRNELISEVLRDIERKCKLNFITRTRYAI